MDETVLFPSPNWYQVSCLAVSVDGWLVYGGPSKSLCVLEPLPKSYDTIIKGNNAYKANVLLRAHPEKIVSVDISPEWPNKRSILTGSADGSVKQWSLSHTDDKLNIKTSQIHEVHSSEKEEIVGVGYSTETYAITLGTFGNIVKWDINSNVVKNYSHFLKSFKPTSMACSRHAALQVAVGTRQGVVFLLDLNGQGKIMYKVRGHEEEITQLSWCPQYEVEVRKALKSTLATRLDKIRSEPEPADDSGIDNIPSSNTSQKETSKHEDDLEDTEIVEEDDMFDIYTDHAADEFGHKKYQPEDIYVKVKIEEDKEVDYLAECAKLKDEILKKKSQGEPSIQSLVEALDKTHVDASVVGPTKVEKDEAKNKTDGPSSSNVDTNITSLHIHRHLLVSIAKGGGVRIWSKTGKLVSSCSVASRNNKLKHQTTGLVTALWLAADTLLIADGKSQLLICNPLSVDCKNKVEWRVVHSLHKRGLYCVASGAPRVHSAGAGMYTVWTTAQDRNLIEYSLNDDKAVATFNTCGGFVYAVATCPYDANRTAVAVGDGAVRVWAAGEAGGGAAGEAGREAGLARGHVATYWQNVQGKVLSLAWHPTKENLLAFGTAEARVGLLDTRDGERAATLLRGAAGAVYALAWGEGGVLYAAGGGELLAYRDKAGTEATVVPVELDGKRWSVSEVSWSERALAVGSADGAVGLMSQTNPPALLAAAFPFTKMIHSVEWHPQQVSSGTEPSKHRDLLAVCSLSKCHRVAILQLDQREDGGIKLSAHSTLVGHAAPVFSVAWDPHRDAHLLSTSKDGTARVWDVLSGTCTSIFSGHASAALGCAWIARAALSGAVLTTGTDATLRLWRPAQHPPEAYLENKSETTTITLPFSGSRVKKEKKHKKDKKDKDTETAQNAQEQEKKESSENTPQIVATSDENKLKPSKKFILPIMQKNIVTNCIKACRRLLEKKYQNTPVTVNGDSQSEVSEKSDANSQVSGNESQAAGVKEAGGGDGADSDRDGTDFIKLFGSTNDVNEYLETELSCHAESERHDSWLVLCMARGDVAAMMQYATQRNIICPYLLSLAPSVSYKYWKEVTQLYLAQIDRLLATGVEQQLTAPRAFGGAVYRRAVSLLALHEARAAVAALSAHNLHKEAYALCRLRHMDSVAAETLLQWAEYCHRSGALANSALCYIALGDLTQAASVLGKSEKEEHLSLAAEVAKLSGQPTYAAHIAEKSEMIKNKAKADTVHEILKELPTRMELLMKTVGKTDDDGKTAVNDDEVKTAVNDDDGKTKVNDEVKTAVNDDDEVKTAVKHDEEVKRQ